MFKQSLWDKGLRGIRADDAYFSWADMKVRCNNPNAPNYKYYGGRGITYCKRWSDYPNFFRDMGPRPEGHTLDRIDGAKGYSPSNCRWATIREQQNNLSSTRWVNYQGERLSISQLAHRVGLTPNVLWNRLFYLKWPLSKAISVPARTSDHRRFLWQGERLSLTELARRVEIPYPTLWGRMFGRGWPLEKALTTRPRAKTERRKKYGG